MSKKILKRSLALGALMAFVITGSAWAGELTSNEVGADGFKIIGGIGNQDGLPSGETTDGNWKLNGYKLIVNKEAKYGYAVYANGYSFQGDAGSTLEIKASDGNEKLTYGLGVDGTIKVDNLIIESESRAIYGAAPTTITAKNISITADEIAVITEPGTQQLSITSTELLNLQGDIVAESGAVSIDAKKGEIKGDIYSHEWFNKEGKSSGASTVSVKLGKDSILTGKVVTDNVSTTKFELNGGAIWNVTDDSNISYITGTSYKVTGTGEQNLTVVNEKNTGDVDSNGIYSTGTAEITGLEKLDVTSANRHALEVAAGMRITNVGTVKLNTTNSGNGIQAYGDLYIDNVDTLEIDVVNHGIRAAKQDGHDANVNINVKDLIIRGDETALKASSGAEIDVTATETAVVEGDIVAEDTGKVGLEISGTTSRFTGAITTSEGAATTLTLNNGASWEITGVSTVTNVAGNEGKLVVTDTKNGV
ncbi:MAG: hypothetical protein IJ376_01100, partial [Acidaminococcaceae bacterium]|nr:hypothetical protein [Acidaminococcaceae bacterium]